MGRFPVKESHQPWQGKHKRENGILISINFGHTLSAPKVPMSAAFIQAR
jgi:hypothetical protein